MDKNEALELIQELVQATTRHVKVANKMSRGSVSIACNQETRAIKNVFSNLCPDERLTPEDIQKIQQW